MITIKINAKCPCCHQRIDKRDTFSTQINEIWFMYAQCSKCHVWLRQYVDYDEADLVPWLKAGVYFTLAVNLWTLGIEKSRLPYWGHVCITGTSVVLMILLLLRMAWAKHFYRANRFGIWKPHCTLCNYDIIAESGKCSTCGGDIEVHPSTLR